MRAQLHNIVLAYDASGSGRPLLLLHGYPLSRKTWRPQLENLGDAARVIAPDLRGSGESEVTEPPYGIDQLADDAAELLDELKVSGPAVVAGLSMGGYVALAFYRRHLERTAGLILAATRAGADSEAGKANRDKAIALAREKGVEAIAESMLPKLLAPETYQTRPELVHEVRQIMASSPLSGVIGDLAAMRDRPDSTELLGSVTKPVLVIHGQEDQLILPSEAEAMYARLPNARLKLIPHAGHLLNMEQPEAFEAEVRNFLKSF
jgi:pimeloyl-ACP methyl ester carboxylesterase